MKSSEYVTTVLVKNYVVNIGIDDYGQCYFIEWVEKNENHENELRQLSLGTYCTDYLESTYSIFDYKGTSISLYGKEEWDKDTALIKKRFIDSGYADENPEAFSEWLADRNREDYGEYDFPKMYEELRCKNDK